MLFDLQRGQVADTFPDIPGIFGNMIVVALDSVVYLIGCASKAYTMNLSEKVWNAHDSVIERGYGKRYTLIGRKVALFMNTNYDLSNRSFVTNASQTMHLYCLDTFTMTRIDLSLPILGPFCPIPINDEEILIVGGFESYSADGIVLTLKNLKLWRVNVNSASTDVVGTFTEEFEETYIATPGANHRGSAFCISNRQIIEVNLADFTPNISFLDRTALRSVLQFAWVYRKATTGEAEKPQGLQRLHKSVFRYATRYLKLSN